MAYPHILDEAYDLGKDDMKSIPNSELGSWERVVTTSDGCWHISFSAKTVHSSSEITSLVLYYSTYVHAIMIISMSSSDMQTLSVSLLSSGYGH